jgi:hypothetical protein
MYKERAAMTTGSKKAIQKIQEQMRFAAESKKTKLFCLRLPQNVFDRIKAAKLPGTTCADYVRAAIDDRLKSFTK